MKATSLLFLLSTVLAQAESPFLSKQRQLTFEGKRAGEGYFSADGKKMIFQSEREEGNPFYQIYLLDLETGDQERVSPGMGKTTCAWIHPDGKRVMFASTHLDPETKKKQEAEIAERKSNRVRKYSWDYDETYELFEYHLETKAIKQLTNSVGYDAEGCWSPDGRKFVFASNRAAYSGTLNEADKKRLEIDKAYFMDLFIADADGSNVHQLTNVPGYDGGVFFSPDGQRLCWRRFDEKGMVAEIWTMKIDGTDPKQITKLGAMSWAPYFHPSGDYLVFTTNLHGFDNFELYIVDAAGANKPVRVTEDAGFDGLPVFSPDGGKLAWTIDRSNNKAGQIYLADWNHEAAKRALSLGKAAPKPTVKGPDPKGESADIAEADLLKHIQWLASDELDGRLTGTEGERLATEYVAKAFEAQKLMPSGENGGWYDEFDFTAGVALGEGNVMSLASKELVADKDWRPLSFSQTGKVAASGVVFAGYGIETPEEATGDDGKKMEPYSSYAHLDVKDKWVLVLRYLPEGIDSKRRIELNRYSSLRQKAMIAREKGARGLLVASGPTSKVVEQLVPMQFDASLATSGIPAISVTDAVATDVLKTAGKDLKALQEQLDTGTLMGGIPCGELKVSAEIAIKQEKNKGRSVIAVLPAKAEPDFHTPPLIIGAHVDHLGSKASGSSRAMGDETSKVHHGADDNASGVAGMLEIAEWMADMKAQGKLKLSRDVIFAAWSGEELGLLGSNHWAESLAKMITGDGSAKLKGMIAAYLNMDMIGRFNKTVVLQGVGSSSFWPGEIERRNAPIGLPITTQNDAHLPTDSTVFYLRGIPTLSAFTGSHDDYHRPSDTWEKINLEKTAQIAKLMGLIARGIATQAQAPDYVVMEAPKSQARGGMRAYLGTIPDYAQGDIKGVKLSGVSGTGPAAKAGVKGGDVIIKLGGQNILNIYDYTSILADLKIGKATNISVQRDGKTLEMSITPGSRE